MAYIKQDDDEQQGSGLNQALVQQQQPQEEQQPQQETTPQLTTPSQSASTPSPTVKALPTPQKAGTGTFANLRSYLEAGKGSKIASAASQRLSALTTGAQKGIKQAETAFGKQVGAGSGSTYRGTQPGQFLNPEQAAQEAQKSIKEIIGTARGVTYQAPQPAPTEDTIPKIGVNPPLRLDGRETPILYGNAGLDADKARLEEARKNGVFTTEPTTPVPAKTQPQAPAVTQQYFTPEQQQRFADIINAQYAGPQSLQQAGLYQGAEQKTRAAQQALKNIATAEGRQQFLRDIYGKGRDYTEGQARLDALLLNVSPEAVGRLQQTAAQTGDIATQLQRAENVSRALALGRTAELADIQKQARDEFETQRAQELGATESRIAQAKATGEELGSYMQGIFQKAGNKPVDLSSTEAAILGIKSGEGIYNLTGDQLVKLNQLRDEQLISKTERARLEALVRLAELDKQKQLQTQYFEKYKDAGLAGTQSAMDVLNTQAIRDAINAEEQKFLKQANRAITGYGEGSAKYNKGFFQGRGTVTAEAEFSRNLKNLLSKSGYDVTPEKEALLSSPDVLKAIVASAQTSGAQSEQDILKNALNILNTASQSDISRVTGAIGEGAKSQSPVEGLDLSEIGTAQALQSGGESLAAYAGAGAGGVSATSLGPYYLLFKLATDADFREKIGATARAIGGNELGDITGAAMESFDAAAGLTDMLGEIGSLGTISGLGTSIFGGGKSGARKKAQAEAERKAATDLQNKIRSSLEKAGFERRSTILSRPELEKQMGELSKKEAEVQTKIKDIQANQAKLQKYSQNPEFSNLLGTTIQQDFLGPRTEAFPKEQQLTNIDNELKSLKEQLKTASDKKPRFSFDGGGFAPTKDSIKSKIKALEDMQGLIKSDLSTQLDLEKKALGELAPQIKQQRDYLSRVGGVEERNVGLQALLKKLDTTNM